MSNNYMECAVTVNGQYIEAQIDGYKTIYVKGRESIQRDVDAFYISGVDGSRIRSSRYDARTITVGFVISCSAAYDCQLKFNKLKTILSSKEARFIFDDEPDKYFTGIPSIEEAPDGMGSIITGEWDIFCADPFKYSLAETTVNFDTTTKTINYAGGYKAHPKLTVQFGSETDSLECGYVGIVDGYNHILQFGNPEEQDYTDIEHKMTTPLNKKFSSLTNWATNSTATISSSTYEQAGTITTSNNHTSVSGYGSGSNYHGPSIRYLTTDSSESKNFIFNWKSAVVGSKSEFGCQQVLLYNNNNGTRTLIGGVNFLKNTKDTKCKVNLYVGNATYKKQVSVACSKIGECTMTKQGTKVTFNVAGKNLSYSSTNIENLVVNEIAFYFAKKGSKTALSSNAVYNAKLKRMAYTERETENIFSAGDTLEVDCSDASVTLNGEPAQWLGALGNDWEDFVLNVGNNTLAFSYSDWVQTTPAPTLTLKYKERFL